MPPQDQALVKDADLEPMLMNLKEGDCYVVNHGEGMTVVDFGGYISMAEKRLLCCQPGWGDSDGVGKVPLHEEDNLMQKDVDGEEGPSQISCDRGEDDRLDRWTSKGYH
ncbi:hypothetical protein BHM03_00040399 [Ensete ventricosum]|nr:hypothetical protein BHM03_00040399 [Ensete ventricosum]